MRTPPRIAAVVPVRMSSPRMAGKALVPVAGQPLLWHVLHRLRKSQRIGAVCVATTTDASDDAIVPFALAQGAHVVRGQDGDALGQTALAAEATDPDIIVRVQADAALFDPSFADALIDALLREGAEFAVPAPGTQEGVEVFTRAAFDRLRAQAGGDPMARASVTGYFRAHPSFVRTITAAPAGAARLGGARLTVDTPADVAFVEAVYARLAAQAGEATLADLVALLDGDPALAAINGHVRDARRRDGGARVLIRVDGGGRQGLAAVRQMLALGAVLRDRHGCGVTFALQGPARAESLVRADGFETVRKPEHESEADWIVRLAGSLKIAAAVFRIETGLAADVLTELRRRGILAATVDDVSPRRLSADLAFYGSAPQVRALAWPADGPAVHAGWEWTILAGGAAPLRPVRTPAQTALVAASGQGQRAITLRAARALAGAAGLRTTIVVGADMQDQAALVEELFALDPNFSVVLHPDRLAPWAAAADIALTGFGPNAAEIAACGTPALYLCASADDAFAASEFDRAGMGRSLGLAERCPEAQILRAVQALAQDGALRRDMAAAGRLQIDGRGAERVADALASRMRGAAQAGQAISA